MISKNIDLLHMKPPLLLTYKFNMFICYIYINTRKGMCQYFFYNFLETVDRIF